MKKKEISSELTSKGSAEDTLLLLQNANHSVPDMERETTGEIILYQPDETLSLQVKLDAAHDTVWLTQQQIAELFGVKRAAISKHMKNIFMAEELLRHQVVSKMETTASDGKRYQVDYYNLDMILSVGYRVNSQNASRFRQWANSVLKQYILKIALSRFQAFYSVPLQWNRFSDTITLSEIYIYCETGRKVMIHQHFSEVKYQVLFHDAPKDSLQIVWIQEKILNTVESSVMYEIIN